MLLLVTGCSKAQVGEQTAGAASAIATGSATAAAPPTTTAATSEAPRRVRSRNKLSCSELLAKTEKVSQRLKMATKTTAGTWGNIPKEVQAVPPGAQHCGSMDLFDQALVVSELTGKALETFYAPLFAKAGCEPFTCKDEATGDDTMQTRCQCDGDGFLGAISTDVHDEAYTISRIEVTFNKKKP